MRREGFTLIELLVVILILGILITIAAMTFLGAPEKAKQTKCLANLDNLFKLCINYSMEYNSFPWGGDGARYYEHWQALVNEMGQGKRIDPNLFVCPSMIGIKAAEKDQDRHFVLAENNCAYAYAIQQRTQEDGDILLAADKDVKIGAQGKGHPEIIITLSCDGTKKKNKVREGENWDSITRGELAR